MYSISERFGPVIAEHLAESARLRSALQEVRDELLDRIDGATESAGRDTWISSLILICERGLGKA